MTVSPTATSEPELTKKQTSSGSGSVAASFSASRLMFWCRYRVLVFNTATCAATAAATRLFECPTCPTLFRVSRYWWPASSYRYCLSPRTIRSGSVFSYEMLWALEKCFFRSW